MPPAKNNNSLNKVTKALFFIYMAVLCWILLFKLGVRFSYMEKRSVNLIPLSELFTPGKIDLAEMILNVVIFVPPSIYAGVLFTRWSFGKHLFFFFFISLVFESLQFFLSIGAFDVTDIITNSIGGLIGLILFKAIEKLVNNNTRTQKFINIIAATGTSIMILLLVLLKMNMLPIRYQ